MKKKGQLEIGGIIMLGIAIIVGAVIFAGGVSQNVGTMTQTATYNGTASGVITAATYNGTVELNGVGVVGTPTIYNRTSGAVVSNGNFTFVSLVGADGQKSLFMLTSTNAAYRSQAVNVTYTYMPDGYVEDSGGRAITMLIPIAFALLILAGAIAYVLGKKGLIDMFN